MHRRAIVFAAAAAMLAACSRQQENSDAESGDTAPADLPDPAAAVRPIYDPYLTEGAEFPEFRNQAPWSAGLWVQLEAMMARSQAAGEPILDFDPVIDAQDYQLSNLNVTTDAVVANSHATARASFVNGSEPREVIYDLVWENGAWRVDNIRTAQWDLRQIAAGP